MTTVMVIGIAVVLVVGIMATLTRVGPVDTEQPPVPAGCAHASVPWPVMSDGDLVAWLCEECSEQRRRFIPQVFAHTVVCAHEEFTDIRTADGELILRLCSQCGLSEGTDPLVFGEGEGEAWWDHKPAAKKIIDAARPGVNRVQDQNQALREYSLQLSECIRCEEELFGSADSQLVRAYNEIERVRRGTWDSGNH